MGCQTYCETSEEFPGVQGKVVPTVLSVLDDAAIDEKRCGRSFVQLHSQANSCRAIDALQLVRLAATARRS